MTTLAPPPLPQADTSTAVSVDGVTKRYASGLVALDGIDLKVGAGEFLCLVGASGCGKSTLLNLIAGLDRPTTGSVTVAGRATLLFQEAALLPWLTAAGNVELALRLQGVGKAQRRSRASELLELVHLGGMGGRRPHELSGGMRQRVALARALAQDADVLLMDEPFGALDAMTRDLLHDELERVWHDTGKTIIFVTHNVREAARLGDRITLLTSRPGRVAATFDVDIERPRRIEAEKESQLAGRVTAALRVDQASLTTELAGLDALETEIVVKKSFVQKFWPRFWPKIAALAIVIALWQLVVASHWRPDYIFPGPKAVLTTLLDQMKLGTFWGAVGRTMKRAVQGYAAAMLIGGIVGALVATVKPLRSAFGALITGLQTMPSIAWFPMAVLLFKLSESAIAFVVVMGAAPAIANGLISGVDHVPPLLLRAGRVLGARKFTLFRHVILPAALPSVLGGLKQAWAFAWRSLMAAELLAPSLGRSIGADLQTARDLADAKALFASMVILLAIGLLVDSGFGAADNALRRRWGLVDPAN